MKKKFNIKTLEALGIFYEREGMVFITMNLKGKGQVHLQTHIHFHCLFHPNTQVVLLDNFQQPNHWTKFLKLIYLKLSRFSLFTTLFFFQKNIHIYKIPKKFTCISYVVFNGKLETMFNKEINHEPRDGIYEHCSILMIKAISLII